MDVMKTDSNKVRFSLDPLATACASEFWMSWRYLDLID